MECQQNFTLIKASGICGCINNYYFTIDALTRQGQCLAKLDLAPSLSKSSEDDLIFAWKATAGAFYSQESQISLIIATIKVDLQGALLTLNINYTINFDASDQFTITLLNDAGISQYSVLTVDFSKYNEIEGLSTIVTSSNVTYKFSKGYAYLHPETKETLLSIGQKSAIGALAQAASTTSFTALLGGASGAALFLLDALGELEMIKYLNVNFPKNFVAFYEGFYATSILPNLYAYINRNDTVQTSNYYKFADWQTPVFIH